MPASTGPNLGMKYGWSLGESGWNVDMDANLKLLDAVGHLSVKDRNLAAPPGSPTEGSRYIVGPSATGAWASKDGQIALYISGGWVFYAPKVGWRTYIEDEDAIVVCSSVAPITWSAGHKLNQIASASQAAVTLGNTDNEIGGLVISAAYDQLEVQALRDKCEELADDVRNLSALVHALRDALVNTNIIKGSA